VNTKHTIVAKKIGIRGEVCWVTEESLDAELSLFNIEEIEINTMHVTKNTIPTRCLIKMGSL
jgi:hypothetical protein